MVPFHAAFDLFSLVGQKSLGSFAVCLEIVNFEGLWPNWRDCPQKLCSSIFCFTNRPRGLGSIGILGTLCLSHTHVVSVSLVPLHNQETVALSGQFRPMEQAHKTCKRLLRGCTEARCCSRCSCCFFFM